MFTIKKIAIAVFSFLMLTACTGTQSNQGVSKDVLMGAGASFPFPFYSKIFEIYQEKTGSKVNYQAIGSGGGIRQLFNNTVDFGATDSFILDKKLATFSYPVLHIPTCMGAVSLSYNLGPGFDNIIVLTGEIISDIFLGKIKYWDDSRITSLSPQNFDLPHLKITPVYRSDGSGTTAIFTDYLSKVSSEWKSSIGSAKSIAWPVGVGAKGNAGVAGILKQLPGSISYLNHSYSISNDLPIAALFNRFGKIVSPTSESITLAASLDVPIDTRMMLTDSSHPNAYPIVGFTWLLVYQYHPDRTAEQTEDLKNLLLWVVNDAQVYAEDLFYSSLPQNLIVRLTSMIETIK